MKDISTRCGGDDAGRPFVVGTLRGYRTWLPRSARDLPAGALPLASVQFPQVIWEPTLQARCLAHEYTDPGASLQPLEHQAPAAGCRCGVYGWYHPHDRRIVWAPVFGVIAVSGVIMLGTHGFRANQARIVAIVTRDQAIVAACAHAGIAVYRRRRHLVRDYPRDDVTALLKQHA